MKIPYGKQLIDKNDVDAVSKTVASPFLTQGPKVKEFEDALTKYTGAKYAVAVSHGTAALHLAYLAAGFKNGDEIITTPNTFVATTNMMLVVGAKPVFCDIKLETYNIDEDKIEPLITQKTKAIVPVHFAGRPCNMKKIIEIAKRHNLLVIEDAAHALGSSFGGKKIGNIGDMTVFSFHPVKTITTGEGGAVLTNNKDFYEKLLSLRSHGIHKDKDGFNVMTEMGYNYRLTDIEASLGVSQMKKIDKFLNARKKVVNLYCKYLAGNEEIIMPSIKDSDLSAWHIYVILVKDKTKRLPLYKYLKDNGIMVNFHYPAVYSHPYYRENGYKDTNFPNEEKYHYSAITLPLYPLLSKDEVEHICRIINLFYAK